MLTRPTNTPFARWTLGYACAALLAATGSAHGEQVEVSSLDGTRLPAVFEVPRGPGPHPAVVMLHGCGGIHRSDGELPAREQAWRDILLEAGYAVLIPDSFSPRGPASLCKVRDRPVLPQRERPGDLLGALRWLRDRNEIDGDRIAVIGWSNGAMALLWTLLREDIGFRAAIAFYPGCMRLRRERPDWGSDIPLLLHLGGRDDRTLPGPCRELAEVAAADGDPVQVVVYPEAYHGFDHPNSRPRTVTARNSDYRGGEKMVHAGTHAESRSEAIRRTLKFLAERMGRPSE